MKNKYLLLIALLCTSLVACGNEESNDSNLSNSTPDVPSSKDTVPVSYPPFKTEIINSFDSEIGLDVSNGWKNGSPFRNVWTKDNVTLEDGKLKMALTGNRDSSFGSEVKTWDNKHYGYYETSMKPLKCQGTVSSFFTYTGPEENTQHDEIDIEFLGKDTTKVQFNYYKNHVGGHEKLYDLGFDASASFHRYGFLWTDTYIAWYVDGKIVHKVDDTVHTPGRLFANVRCGDASAVAVN